MRVRNCIVSVAGAIGIVTAVPLRAQDTAGTAQPELTVPSMAAVLAHDSAAGLRWMVRGRTDWSRYDTPGACLAALTNVDFQRRARSTFDTARAGSASDSISSVAVATGRTCGTRFTPESVPVRELRNLRNLALAIGDAPLAQRAVDRLSAEAPTPYARVRTVQDAIISFISASPPQFQLADVMLARMDTLGRLGRLWRLSATSSVEEAALQRLPLDTTTLIRRARQQRAEVRALRATPADVLGIGSFDFTNAPWVTHVYQAAPQVPDAAALDAISEGVLDYFKLVDSANAIESTKAWVDNAALRTLHTFGNVVPPLMPDYWFAPDDTVPTSTLVAPIPGHVTVFLPVTKIWGVSKEVAACLRLYQKYAKNGFDVVLVHNLNGFAWSSPPLEPLPEAKVMAWFFHDYRKLPWPLAVFKRTFVSTPDGGRRPVPTAFEEQTSTYVGTIVGRDGRRYPIAGWLDHEPVFEAFLRKALGLDTAEAK